MTRAVARLKSKMRPDCVVMLFFGGYGIQAGRESYMIPVDATIWKESDVRRNGVSHRIRARRDEGAGRLRQARRHRRLAPQPL